MAPETIQLYKARFRPKVASENYNRNDQVPWLNMKQSNLDKLQEILNKVLEATENTEIEVIFERVQASSPA